jgi:hypothetical protein
MVQAHRFAILMPLMVGAGAGLCTALIHAVPLNATINVIRREKNWGDWEEASGLTWEL